MSDVKRSRRGVYYDLTISPYEFKSPYGDTFKFSSAKKLEIYTRDVKKEVDRLDDLIKRYELVNRVPFEILATIRREVYRSFYDSIEG